MNVYQTTRRRTPEDSTLHGEGTISEFAWKGRGKLQKISARPPGNLYTSRTLASQHQPQSVTRFRVLRHYGDHK
jgi:hypothetical protein